MRGERLCEGRVLLLSVFLICQLVVIALYIWGSSPHPHSPTIPVRFRQDFPPFAGETPIILPTHPVQRLFTVINDTWCFTEGTDLMRPIRNGKCECLPGHHGKECSLPEVIWRAFIASRYSSVINRRQGVQRRILLVSEADSAAHQAAQLHVLKDVVDLFVVPSIQDKRLLKGLENKILVGKTWQDKLENLHNDDLVLYVPAHVIPLPAALLFFKLHDGFPSPIRFRLKWNVYGYFFQHPNKTRLYPETDASLTIGDLNHYGGWYCELCTDHFNASILDAVGEGLYTDQRTLLLRNHDSQPYFAPQYLLNNSWQFESLLNNVYDKFDYN